MKYIFQFPFDKVLTGYVISHNLFLSSEERKSLQNEKEVMTVGICVPVFVTGQDTSEPAKEIFCSYRVIPNKQDRLIYPVEHGWALALSKEYVRSLSDIKDGGCEFLSLARHDRITTSEAIFPVIHQIVVSGTSSLEQSVYCVHLTQDTSK